MKKVKVEKNCDASTKVDEMPCLPPDLIENITKRLETQTDICNFRAVCKHWQHFTPLSLLHPPKPLLHPLLPHLIDTHMVRGGLTDKGWVLNLVASTMCLIRPRHAQAADPTQQPRPWLVAVEELNLGKLFLRKPLSRTAIRELPMNCPKVLDFAKFEVLQIHRGYYIRSRKNLEDMFQDNMWAEDHCKKVVMLVNPACPLHRNPTIDDCVAFVLHSNGQLQGKQLGGAKENYYMYDSLWRYATRFDDVVDINGEVYAIDRRGRVYVIKCNGELRKVVCDPVTKGFRNGKKKWLAECLGKLYLVLKDTECSDGCLVKVYKLDEGQGCWKEVDSVGEDRILFVTFDGSFFVSVTNFPGWKGNCIVFSKGAFPSYRNICVEKREEFPVDIAVYDFNKDGKLHYSGDSAYPRDSLRYWQPPTWFSSNNCSSGW